MIMSKLFGKYLFGKYYRHQTVVNWIKRAGLKVLSAQTKQEKVEILEMDELYTYVKKKERKTRIWTAVNRKKMRITAFEIGLGKSSSFKTLFSTMTKKNQGLQQITTDVRPLNSPISAY